MGCGCIAGWTGECKSKRQTITFKLLEEGALHNSSARHREPQSGVATQILIIFHYEYRGG